MKCHTISTKAAAAGYKTRSFHPYWQDVCPLRSQHKSHERQANEARAHIQLMAQQREKLAGKRILSAINQG